MVRYTSCRTASRRRGARRFTTRTVSGRAQVKRAPEKGWSPGFRIPRPWRKRPAIVIRSPACRSIEPRLEGRTYTEVVAPFGVRSSKERSPPRPPPLLVRRTGMVTTVPTSVWSRGGSEVSSPSRRDGPYELTRWAPMVANRASHKIPLRARTADGIHPRARHATIKARIAVEMEDPYREAQMEAATTPAAARPWIDEWLDGEAAASGLDARPTCGFQPENGLPLDISRHHQLSVEIVVRQKGPRRLIASAGERKWPFDRVRVRVRVRARWMAGIISHRITPPEASCSRGPSRVDYKGGIRRYE